MSAQRTDGLFRLEVSVTAQLPAPPATVWARLTEAEGYPRWNPTVTRIQGPITLGQRLEIEVPTAPGRTFRPTVVEMDAPRSMVWQDGFAPMFQGTRSFTLTEAEGGATTFTMREVFVGLMLPLIQGSLPDLCGVFDAYAAALAASFADEGEAAER
jgi:uncharacterized protein YndB with AHSA1/START domain